jgi:hypothetical protein
LRERRNGEILRGTGEADRFLEGEETWIDLKRESRRGGRSEKRGEMREVRMYSLRRVPIEYTGWVYDKVR